MRQRTWWQTLRLKKHLYVYLIPTFFMLAIFNYYPPLSAFYHAFFNWDGNLGLTFVGLGNFQQMLQDSNLIESVPHLLLLMLASLVTGLSVPLLVAEAIFSLRSARMGYIYRLLFVVPVVVPVVVTILFWQFILDPNVGLLDAGLGWLRGTTNHTAWLGDPQLALYALMLIGFPWALGVNVLIYLAGLQNIPSSVFDAARLDGAAGWQRFIHVDLPLILGQVKILSILGVIAAAQGFQVQFLLTQGGPGYATMVPAYLMYVDAFENGQFGYGSAIGFVLFLVILAFTYLNMRYVRSSVEYEAT